MKYSRMQVINGLKKSAIRDIMDSEFKDIMVDDIVLKKFRCFNVAGCRKTFDDLEQLVQHQKIHVSTIDELINFLKIMEILTI